jgi:hypothetical protein
MSSNEALTVIFLLLLVRMQHLSRGHNMDIRRSQVARAHRTKVTSPLQMRLKPDVSPLLGAEAARAAISETLPWTFASPDARGLGLFLFQRRLNKTTTSRYTHFRKDYRKMAHLSGPPMSYSSMKGRLHDGLLKGLEVMGYE